MSIRNILQPNDFKIYGDFQIPGEVTADSTTTFTNKTLLDPSNSVAADRLFASNKSVTVDIQPGAAPSAPFGQSLVTTSTTSAEWLPVVEPDVAATLTNKTITDSSNDVNAKGVFWSDQPLDPAITLDVVGAATPTTGQVLTITNEAPLEARWGDPVPGQALRGTFGPVSILAGIGRKDIGPEITLIPGPANGSWMFSAKCVGIGNLGNLFNGECRGSFKVTAGILTNSDPGGATGGWEYYNGGGPFTPTAVCTWSVSSSGFGAQLQGNNNSEGITFNVSWEAYFVAGP